MKTKRVLVLTGGGDCPGLNAVIRGIVKRASREPGWEVIGSREAFNGVLSDPMELVTLDLKAVSGIHARGGTILGTTTKGGPFNWPVQQPDGTWISEDRSDDMLRRLRELQVEAVISIGGDGSQRISQALYEKGLNVIGVPKTIDNDLSATDFTFGFQTAVREATEAIDKLVTTAESHHRVMILEVMGRSAGWIALHAAIAGGAEVCLIPEIPYSLDHVAESIRRRFDARGRGFAIVVIAEGAKPAGGSVVARKSTEIGYENLRLGGVGHILAEDLKSAGCPGDIRVTILGHLQRGGNPDPFDRILASRFGVKAFEMVLEGQFGHMVSFRNNDVTTVTLKEAVAEYNLVNTGSSLVGTARGLGIAFGD